MKIDQLSFHIDIGRPRRRSDIDIAVRDNPAHHLSVTSTKPFTLFHRTHRISGTAYPSPCRPNPNTALQSWLIDQSGHPPVHHLFRQLCPTPDLARHAPALRSVEARQRDPNQPPKAKNRIRRLARCLKGNIYGSFGTSLSAAVRLPKRPRNGRASESINPLKRVQIRTLTVRAFPRREI